MPEKTRQGRTISEAELEEHGRLCDALWDQQADDYKARAEARLGRVYFCDGVWAGAAEVVKLRTALDRERTQTRRLRRIVTEYQRRALTDPEES